MTSSDSTNQLNKSIEVQKDFYKTKLLNMGYFKTPDGQQLYELSLNELENLYKEEKSKRGPKYEG